jgi:hypothetical protein
MLEFYSGSLFFSHPGSESQILDSICWGKIFEPIKKNIHLFLNHKIVTILNSQKRICDQQALKNMELGSGKNLSPKSVSRG